MPETAQEVQETQDQQENTGQTDSKMQAQSVEFTEAAEGIAVGSGTSIDILLDMSLPVTAAVGRAEIQVRRLLQLGPGSVLKLDKPIDEPVDLYLKDTKFATGNVVVVDGQFAVKIEQILGARAAAAAEAAAPAPAPKA
jgi:flagellar motor switch protein FliN/FliY